MPKDANYWRRILIYLLMICKEGKTRVPVPVPVGSSNEMQRQPCALAVIKMRERMD